MNTPIETPATQAKPLWASKTFWFAVLTIVLGALQAAQGAITDPRALGAIGVVVGFVTFLLRTVTREGVRV